MERGKGSPESERNHNIRARVPYDDEAVDTLGPQFRRGTTQPCGPAPAEDFRGQEGIVLGRVGCATGVGIVVELMRFLACIISLYHSREEWAICANVTLDAPI